jgi:hypothetical protein
MAGFPSGPNSGFRVWALFRHAHLDEAHPAIARRTQLRMITVVRDKFPGLAACFNDARALRELMPDAIDLYVKEFGWCAHCESSVRSIPIFLVGRGRDEFIAEFRDKALSGPRTGFVCVEFVNVVEGATDVSS